jgi:hypothetical protein
MIKRVQRKGKTWYQLVSRTGKNMGTYSSRDGAEKRERQVMFFKNKSRDKNG